MRLRTTVRSTLLSRFQTTKRHLSCLRIVLLAGCNANSSVQADGTSAQLHQNRPMADSSINVSTPSLPKAASAMPKLCKFWSTHASSAHPVRFVGSLKFQPASSFARSTIIVAHVLGTGLWSEGLNTSAIRGRYFHPNGIYRCSCTTRRRFHFWRFPAHLRPSSRPRPDDTLRYLLQPLASSNVALPRFLFLPIRYHNQIAVVCLAGMSAITHTQALCSTAVELLSGVMRV